MPTSVSTQNGTSAASMGGTISAGDPSGINVSELSPDAMMSFLELQLQGSDSQLDKIETDMSQQKTLGDALNNLTNQLNLHQNGIRSGDTGTENLTPDQCDQYRDATDACYQAAIAAAGGASTPTGQQLTASMQKFDTGFGTNGNTNTGGGIKGSDDDLSVGDITSLTQDVKNIQNGMNTQSQMNMIDLQSLMSQRQTFIQLATNMMQSMDDGTKSITTNIGH